MGRENKWNTNDTYTSRNNYNFKNKSVRPKPIFFSFSLHFPFFTWRKFNEETVFTEKLKINGLDICHSLVFDVYCACLNSPFWTLTLSDPLHAPLSHLLSISFPIQLSHIPNSEMFLNGCRHRHRCSLCVRRIYRIIAAWKITWASSVMHLRFQFY